MVEPSGNIQNYSWCETVISRSTTLSSCPGFAGAIKWSASPSPAWEDGKSPGTLKRRNAKTGTLSLVLDAGVRQTDMLSIAATETETPA